MPFTELSRGSVRSKATADQAPTFRHRQYTGEAQLSSDFEESDLASMSILLSSERLHTYQSLTGNLKGAILLHQQSMQVSVALMAVIGIIEIALRNSVSERLAERFQTPHWLTNPPPNFQWQKWEKKNIADALNGAQRAAYAKLSHPEKKLLDTQIYPNGVPNGSNHVALSKARRKSMSVSDGQIIAQLNFSFWKKLFSAQYEKLLWGTSLKRIFPNKKLARAAIAVELEVIYQTRNRIAHHEPVMGDRLDKTLKSIHFVAQNFGSSQPTDETALAKLLHFHRQMLDERILVFRTNIASYKTAYL